MGEKFEHKKSLGQHFLNSDYVPQKMVAAAGVMLGDIVLEIGPGTGILTRALLTAGATVIALEADSRALAVLEEAFPVEIKAGTLTLHHHDVRSLDPAQFGLRPHQYKVVANIPYYLSGLLFRSLLETKTQPTTLVFLVQKEVAVRIARDKKASLLSLSIKAFGNPTYICTVGKSHFTPPPQIDSAIIAVTDISEQKLAGVDKSAFFELLHLGFGQKRKQLLGNLSARFDKAQVIHSFEAVGLSLTVRAEDISLETWVALATQLLSPPSAQS